MDELQKIREMISRYFKARYGDDYAFKAPETFDNALERWMLYVMSNEGLDMAEQEMAKIEAWCRA
jgi:hypothetical protein